MPKLKHCRSGMSASPCPMKKIEIDGQKIDRITREISLDGDLTPEQRTRMLEIANRCPVHRTISGGSNLRIESRLVDRIVA